MVIEMAVNGMGNNNLSNLYSSIFGMGSSGGGVNLGEYAMLKNGAYKKLLKSYYGMGEETKKSSSSSKSDSDDSTDKTSSSKKTYSYRTNTTERASRDELLSAKQKAENVKASRKKLDEESLYESTGQDDMGRATYNTDAISKAVKSFVSDYNSLVSSTKKMDSSAVSKKSIELTSMTAQNASQLKEIGITINSDLTLTVDEEKLKKADVSQIESLFSGSDSFGKQVEDMADQMSKQANSLTYTQQKAMSYSYDGKYLRLDSSYGATSQYM